MFLKKLNIYSLEFGTTISALIAHKMCPDLRNTMSLITHQPW